MKKFKIKILNVRSRGFTLVELLISLAIISILSATIIVNIKSGSDEQALLRSAQKLAFDIRRVQNLALSPEKYGANSVCFYGVKLDTVSSYFLYYDDQSPCPPSIQYDDVANPGKSTKLETVNLERGVQFNVFVSKDAAFSPPEPIVYFNGFSDFVAESLVLSLISNPTRTKTVVISKFGNVEIQ